MCDFHKACGGPPVDSKWSSLQGGGGLGGGGGGSGARGPAAGWEAVLEVMVRGRVRCTVGGFGSVVHLPIHVHPCASDATTVNKIILHCKKEASTQAHCVRIPWPWNQK